MQINKVYLTILLIGIVGLFSTPSVSQQLDPLLQDLIHKGLSKSQTVNINAIQAEQAQLDQRLAKSVFIPKITF